MAKYNQILAATAFPAGELAAAGQAANAANVLQGRAFAAIGTVHASITANAPDRPGDVSETWRERKMKWETPESNDIRFGFEVTMYINNK